MTTLSRFGIRAELPAGFEGRIFRHEPGHGEQSYAVAQFATFPLPAVVADFGSGAVSSMSSEDVFVVLFEYGPESAGARLFRRNGLPRPLAADRFLPSVLRRALPGQSGTQWFFTEAGRPFTLYAVLGSHARRATLVPRVNALLEGLAIGSPALILLGPYLAACIVLIVAGASKLARPQAAAASLRAVTGLRWAGGPSLVRAIAACEVSLGAVGIIRPSLTSAGLVGIGYVGLAGYLTLARSRAGRGVDCGCFGTAAAPMSYLHSVLDSGFALCGFAVALSRPDSGIAALMAREPWAGVPLAAGAVVLAILAVLAMSRLARLQQVRRAVGVS